MARAQVIAVFGPTGVGKTAVALELADRLEALGERPVAVSADALQVYRGLEILTGAATPEEQRRLEHRLVSIVPLQEEFSAGRYAELAHGEIDTLLAEGRRPLVVGGTGLYLRAALSELSLRPASPPELRARWLGELERRGARALHRELAARAPAAAKQITPGDRHRIVRALELLDMGAEPAAGDSSELWLAAPRHPTLLIGLVAERERLYADIDGRVEAMLAAGAQQEVTRARAAVPSRTARRALGFQELLEGDIEAMKRHTRQLARRQLTWMRKLSGVEVLDVSHLGTRGAAEHILESWQQGAGS